MMDEIVGYIEDVDVDISATKKEGNYRLGFAARKPEWEKGRRFASFGSQTELEDEQKSLRAARDNKQIVQIEYRESQQGEYTYRNVKRFVDWNVGGIPQPEEEVVKCECGDCSECLKRREAELAKSNMAAQAKKDSRAADIKKMKECLEDAKEAYCAALQREGNTDADLENIKSIGLTFYIRRR
jgi:hypothetical protein